MIHLNVLKYLIVDVLFTACNPDCGITGTCTGTNICTCHAGWTGQTCDMAISDNFLYVNESCLVDEFSFGNGDFNNYHLHMFQGLSKSPNADGSLTMITTLSQSSLIFSKKMLNDLMWSKRNVFVSITSEIIEYNTGDGVFVLFMDKSSLVTPDPISMSLLLNNFFFKLLNF